MTKSVEERTVVTPERVAMNALVLRDRVEAWGRGHIVADPWFCLVDERGEGAGRLALVKLARVLEEAFAQYAIRELDAPPGPQDWNDGMIAVVKALRSSRLDWWEADTLDVLMIWHTLSDADLKDLVE